MTAATRVLRTCAQVLAALVVVIPAVVKLADTLGVHLDGAALAATGAAAVAVVSGLQNALESAGKIPVLGAPKPDPEPAAQPVTVTLRGGPVDADAIKKALAQIRPNESASSLRASAPSTSTEARPEDGPQPEDPYK